MIKIIYYAKSNGKDERKITIDKELKNEAELDMFRKELET